MENNFYAAHPSGVGFHGFGNVNGGAFQRHLHIAGLNAHYGKHAVAQAGGQQVGGRKTLALALVVNGCIGFNQGAALQVGRFRS